MHVTSKKLLEETEVWVSQNKGDAPHSGVNAQARYLPMLWLPQDLEVDDPVVGEQTASV